MTHRTVDAVLDALTNTRPHADLAPLSPEVEARNAEIMARIEARRDAMRPTAD